jgi:excisionase family DNA binding protein
MLDDPLANPLDRALTVEQTMERLGCSRTTINRLLAKGELAGFGSHKLKRISEGSIIQYKMRNRIQPQSGKKPPELRRTQNRLAVAMAECEELLRL